MRTMRRDGQVSSEVKLHYKMYKAGKLWLVAGIGFVGTMLALSGQPVAASAATNTEAVRDAAVKQDAAEADVDQTAATQAEEVGTGSTQEETDSSQATGKEQTGGKQTTNEQPATTAKNAPEASADSSEDRGNVQDEPTDDDQINTAAVTAATTDKAAPQGEETGEAPSAAETKQATSTASSNPEAVKTEATKNQSAESANSAVQKAQVDATSTTMTLQAEQATINSGETATFDFKLNVSGIDSDGGGQQLQVNLPDDFTLSDADLSINGVTPTLDSAAHQLVYDFGTPQNGLSVSKKFNFATTSGKIAAGTPLTVSAQFVDGDTVTTSGDQTVMIQSKAIYGVAAQFIGVLPTDADGNLQMDADGNVTIDKSKLTGRAGDVVAYSVGVSTPKQLAGQAYIEPGTQVQVRVYLPVGMTYVKVDSSTPEPVVSTDDAGKTVLDFFLPAPSLAEQDAAVKNLMTAQFNIVGRINSDVPFGTDLTVNALMGATSINGEKVQSAAATSTIKTVADFSKQGYPTDGYEFYFYAWGPGDDKGNLGSDSQSNTDPQVGPNATLGYVIMLGSADYDFPQWQNPVDSFKDDPELKLTTDGYVREIQKYVATYDVDDHLNVQTLSVGAPYATIRGNTYALDEAPKFNLYVKYQDSDHYEETPILEDITDTGGNILDMTKLLDNSRGVDKLQFVWTTPVAGQTYDNIRFKMTPKAGYYGTVKNSLSVNVSGYDALGWLETRYDQTGAYTVATVPGYTSSEGRVGLEVHLTDSVGDPIEPGSADDHTADYNQYMTDKTAEIVKPADNTPRVLNESIGFTNVTNGKIDTGANQMLVDVDNNKASLQSFSGITTYVVLPEGVTYTGNDAQVTAETVAGKTLLTINWSQKALAPNSANTIALGIEVNDKLNLNNLAFGLYSTVSEADTVVPRTVNPSDASDVQIYSGANLPGLELTQKVYALEIMGGVNSATGHQLMATAAAANGDGDTGALVMVRANENGQYLLNLAGTTDNSLQELTLVATLPQEGDTAVLDSTARGTSTSGVKLSGPIQLPTSWQGKATVSYITADTPDGLDAAAVTDFSQVTGFVISYTDPMGYLNGSSQQIIVPVHVAADAAVGAQAFISYAISANRLQEVEGLKAGITVGARQQASATVTYHDATTDTDLRVDTTATNATLTGDLNTTSSYDSSATIADYLKQGYVLVKDGTKKVDGSSAIAFTTDGATTNYEVVLQHSFTSEAVQTVTQTIHYVDGKGKTLAPDHVASQSFVTVHDQVTKQTQTYTAAGVQVAPELRDGEPTATAWQKATQATFAAVTNPTVASYKVVATSAADGDLTKVGASVVAPTSANQVVTVTYELQAGEVTPPVVAGDLTVRYVDEHGTALLPETVKSGDVGTAFTVVAPQISNYSLTGSGQAQGSFTIAPQTVTFVYKQLPSRPTDNQTTGTLTVHYVDVAGKTLLPDVTQTGTVGTAYTVAAPSISNYTLQGRTSASGNFTVAAQSVTFVYDQDAGKPAENQSATLTVHYQTAEGRTVRTSTTETGYVGNAYVVTPPAISGYAYVGLGTDSAALQGQFAETTTVVLIYKPLASGENTTDTPGGRGLPNTYDDGGTTPVKTDDTPAAQGSLPSTAGSTATPARTAIKKAVVTPQRATRAQRNLPQTGEQRSNVAALLGLGLLALVSGAWFRKREN